MIFIVLKCSYGEFVFWFEVGTVSGDQGQFLMWLFENIKVQIFMNIGLIGLKNSNWQIFWEGSPKITRISEVKSSGTIWSYGGILITNVLCKWEHLSGVWSNSQSMGDMAVPHWLGVNLSLSQRLWNTGLLSSWASLTSWGEGASLALVGHPSSDGVTIKMPYGVDVFIDQLRTPFFLLGWLKLNLALLLD